LPYYSDAFSNPRTLDETDRSQMVVYLDWMIRNQRVKQITITTPENGQQRLYPRDDSSPATIDWLPLPVLFAASHVLSPKRKGLEVDLLVRTESDGYTPVTALQEMDGSVRVEMGPALKSLLPPPERQPTSEDIVRRFEIGAVRDNGRSWEPLELFALEQALTLLSPQERTIVSDISFVRERRAPKGLKGTPSERIWGLYAGSVRQTKGREIHLFDTGPGRDMSRFVGEPTHPYPVTTLCLLHEIGHAIADYARIRIFRHEDELLTALTQVIEEWKAAEAAGKLTEARAMDLDRRSVAFKAKITEIEQRHSAIREQYRQELGPVLAAYLAVRGPDKGPTPYGRTKLEESFAESFALFKADPAALSRIYPDLYDWFASGGHIRALTNALGEDVVPLNQREGQQYASAVRN
jgi:hypothetical protein